MPIVQYMQDGKQGCGVLVGDIVFATGYESTLALIAAGDAGMEAAARATDREPVVVDRLIHPIRPWKILGSGVNYRSHGDEEPGFVFPDELRWDFVKLSSAIVGPGDPIVIPPHDDVIKRLPGGPQPFDEYAMAVDYEVELVVVMGKLAKNVRREEALDYVFGYTLMNDVSARGVQFYNQQVDLGKNFDTFAPIGPVIVTKDELPDWENIRIQAHVNGELRQNTLVGDQIGPPPLAIEWLSSIISLEPGDCLSTGTPAGCGTFMHPAAFLQPGDIVTVSGTGIGELTNPVVQGTARTFPVE